MKTPYQDASELRALAETIENRSVEVAASLDAEIAYIEQTIAWHEDEMQRQMTTLQEQFGTRIDNLRQQLARIEALANPFRASKGDTQ